MNVKTGDANAVGQPNIVSLRKLLDALTANQIDSYWLLMVPIRTTDTGALSTRVQLVDVLDWLDYVAFDAGPGQLMLRQQQFRDAVAGNRARTPRTLTDKATLLLGLLEDGDRRLAANRARRRQQVAAAFDAWTPAAQPDTSSLHLTGPLRRT